MATASHGFLVLDSCVLIDYAAADTSVLALISRYVGQVHVPQQLLEEVKMLDNTECARLGLRVFEPELELLDAAGRHRSGLSFEDRICLLVAKQSGWTCVTSDKKLRRECMAEKVPVLWGLEPMIALVSSGHMSVAEAKKAAIAIQAVNPRFITDALIKSFILEIEAIG